MILPIKMLIYENGYIPYLVFFKSKKYNERYIRAGFIRKRKGANPILRGCASVLVWPGL